MNIQQRVSDNCEFKMIGTEKQCHGHTTVSDEEWSHKGEARVKAEACAGCLASCHCNDCSAHITVDNGVRVVTANAIYSDPTKSRS